MSKPGMPSGAKFFTLITLGAFLITLPLAVIIEGPEIRSTWDAAVNRIGLQAVLKEAAFCAFAYFLYCEVSFIVLNEVGAVSGSVANTFKRVILIAVTAFITGAPIGDLKASGSAIAILGVVLYLYIKRGPAATASKTKTK